MGIFIRDIKDLVPRAKTISLGIRFITIREPTVRDWLYLNSINFEKMEIRDICNIYIKTLSEDVAEVEKLTTIELVTILQECFKMMSRNENTGEKEKKESSDDIYISMSYRIAKFCKNTSTSFDNWHDELLNIPQKDPIGGEGYCMREIDETLEKLCAIWNIPYLSLFKKGLLKPWVPEQNMTFFKQDGVGKLGYDPDAEPDGLHPNTDGHMVIVPTILNFLKEHIAIETQRDKTGVDNFYIPNNSALDNLSIEDTLSMLNSQVYRNQMQQLGILNDYDTYMQDKANYDNQQEDLEIARNKAFTEAIIKDPNINYETWLKQLPMTLPINVLKPEIPQSIIEFINSIKGEVK